MSQIIEYGGVKRGLFGINVENLSYEWLESIQAENLQGALINQIKPGSPAQQSGLREKDVVTSFNGQPVTSANHLHNLLGLMRVGEQVALGVFRDGFALEFSAKIADPYQDYVDGVSVSPYLEGAKLTNFVDNDSDEKLQAIAIGGIEVGSSAWRVDLREGDLVLAINKTEMNDLDRAKALLSEDKPMFHLRIQRDNQIMNLVSPQ